MAVAATDLIEPRGRITGSMFPADDPAQLVARVQRYLDAAYTRSDVAALSSPDEAAEHYAYARAFEAVYLRMSAEPSSVSMSDGGSGAVSTSYTQSQIATFKNMADAEWALFGRLTIVIDTETPRYGGGAVANRFTF